MRDSGHTPKRRLLQAAAILLTLLAGPLLLWALDRQALGVAAEAYFGPRAVVANALVGLGALLLLWALTRRFVFSALLVAGLHWLLYMASRMKLELLAAPVGWHDRFFLSTLDRSSLALFGSYLGEQWHLVVYALGRWSWAGWCSSSRSRPSVASARCKPASSSPAWRWR